MLLYMTSSEPSNSRYCNQEGEVLYKSVCSHKSKQRLAAIWRALPSLKPTPEDRLYAERHFKPSPPPVEEPEDTDNDTDLRRHSSFSSSHDHDFHWDNPLPSFEDFQKVAVETEIQTDFTKVAEVEFHTIASTKIRYQDKEWSASEFFKKEGWAWYGGNRLFTGPDGKEYKWKMGSSVSELFLEDKDTDTKSHQATHPRAHVPFLVARFCSPRDGILHDEKHPPYLEIFPTGEHMVEIILLTFVYIEEMRRQRQKSSTSTTTKSTAAAAGTKDKEVA